jgi:hypothetical protein
MTERSQRDLQSGSSFRYVFDHGQHHIPQILLLIRYLQRTNQASSDALYLIPHGRTPPTTSSGPCEVKHTAGYPVDERALTPATELVRSEALAQRKPAIIGYSMRSV